MELKLDRYRVLAVPPIFVREKWKQHLVGREVLAALTIFLSGRTIMINNKTLHPKRPIYLANFIFLIVNNVSVKYTKPLVRFFLFYWTLKEGEKRE